jgi:hypothetical protein
MKEADVIARARKTLVAIHNHAAHGLRDAPDADHADALKHLSLIAFMANAAIERIDGKESYI